MSTQEERIARFVDAVKDDPRVLGVAVPGNANGWRGIAFVTIIATWDGTKTLPADLPRFVRAAFGAEPVRTRGCVGIYDCSALAADGQLLQITVRGAGDLKPPAGRGVRALHDPRGVIENWVRCSESSTAIHPDLPMPQSADDLPFQVDMALRMHERHPGSLTTYQAGQWLERRGRLSASDAVEDALRARIDAVLLNAPLEVPNGGERIHAFGGRVVPDGPATRFEAFLAAADAEGFKGDRVLFNEATKRLADLAKREPVFDQGFVVPTFDAVEAAFALGEAVGGCQPPLIPGVYVGVGVTPKDALEFWAAPFVRDPTCSVACVDDTGERDVVLRAAGRDPMVATLTSVVDAAFDRLPALIDRARDATKESVDPSAVLATLHLPKTFVERAKRRGADALMCSRLTVALAVARAGHDCAPLVARKFGLAAGRVIAARD